MHARFPLKRSTSVDTIDTVNSFDTMDLDATFVDRMCTKMKKATSPFSTLFVAGTNKQTTDDVVAVKEKRGGISLSSLIRRGSDHGVKSARCDQSVYTQETADVWKLVDTAIETEKNVHDENLCDEGASDSDEVASDTYTDENEFANSSDNESLTQSPDIVTKRCMHHRSTFDHEFRKREDERRFARETAAALVRQRNSHRHQSHSDRNSELCRRSHHNSIARKHRRGRIVHYVDSQLGVHSQHD
jgi:hypothetical protein